MKLIKLHAESRMLYRLAIMALLIMPNLFGCSSSNSSQQTKYYLFDANPKQIESTQAKLNKPQYQVSTVNLPLYLNSSSLVMKKDDMEIVIANYHRWADRLDSSITRALIDDLNHAHAQFLFVTQCNACPSLTLNIDHFYPNAQGEVIIKGSYQLVNAQGSSQPIDFYLQSNLNEDGYAHAVMQMRGLITKLVSTINIEATNN